MVLEAEIAEIEERISALDKSIDSCTSDIELNRIGSEIGALEIKLEPIRRAAAQHAAIEGALGNLKDKVSRLPPRL